MSAKGIETNPKKIEAVKNWTTSKTVTDVRSFLGFTNHYHRFKRGYTKVAKPLNTLVSGENDNRKKALVNWSDECKVAFEKLNDLCTNTPILANVNYKKPFQLQTEQVILVLVQYFIKKMLNVNKDVIPQCHICLPKVAH